MTTAPNLPATIASRYVPIRLIAKGGMGAVYEVEHARTGEHLALKVLHSSVRASVEQLERFKREARASARIKSEYVVRVTDADTAPELDGAPFLVMELLEGSDLERQAAAGPLSPPIVVGWLRQVARALDKAHGMGIVHRDLKPENLFLANAEGRAPMVKVLDFGIIKMTDEGTGATGSGQILGTPRYMAPEQASSKGTITSATDRYSLGLVAYRLLTGESYYTGDVMNVLAQLLHEPLQVPSKRHPTFAGAFDDWFLKACHRNPEERFPSAAEQIEALSAALGLPTVSIAMTSPRGGGRYGPARVAAVVAAVAAAAVVLMVVVFYGRRAPPEAPILSATQVQAPVGKAGADAVVATPRPQAELPLKVTEAPSATATPRSSKPSLSHRRALPAHTVAAPAPATETAKTADPYADQK